MLVSKIPIRYIVDWLKDYLLPWWFQPRRYWQKCLRKFFRIGECRCENIVHHPRIRRCSFSFRSTCCTLNKKFVFLDFQNKVHLSWDRWRLMIEFRFSVDFIQNPPSTAASTLLWKLKELKLGSRQIKTYKRTLDGKNLPICKCSTSTRSTDIQLEQKSLIK